MKRKSGGFTLVELMICVAMVFIVYVVLQALWVSTNRAAQSMNSDQLVQNVLRVSYRRISVDFRNSRAVEVSDSEQPGIVLNEVSSLKSEAAQTVRYYLKDDRLWRRATLADGTTVKDHSITPKGLTAQFHWNSKDLLTVQFLWENPYDRIEKTESVSFVVARRGGRT